MNRILSGASRDIQLAFATASARPTTLRDFVESATAIEDTAKRADAATGGLAVVREAEPAARESAGRTEPKETASASGQGRLDSAEMPTDGCLGCGRRDGHQWRNCPESKKPSWMTGWRLRNLLNMTRSGNDRNRSRDQRPERSASTQPVERRYQYDRGSLPPQRPGYQMDRSRSPYGPPRPYRSDNRDQQVGAGQGARPDNRPTGYFQRWRSRPQEGNPSGQTSQFGQQQPFWRRDRNATPWQDRGNRPFNPNRMPLSQTNPGYPNRSVSPGERTAYPQRGPGQGDSRNGQQVYNSEGPKNGFPNQGPPYRR